MSGLKKTLKQLTGIYLFSLANITSHRHFKRHKHLLCIITLSFCNWK